MFNLPFVRVQMDHKADFEVISALLLLLLLLLFLILLKGSAQALG